ncbi:hypothetical protein GQ57_36085 [Burkholderia sp. MSh2]|uniref:GTPase Era n=2 Tax=Burkholderia TaxID=32008 RepID=A0A6J5F4H0_9BURK|nr:GTPase [Burkholderia paludis]KEZ01255.1 hypothetical protein GQ57_36085 [Burkholderia sp. MSh2]CAB3773688.1 GTPase Era [Burkholderia paludis]VWC17900.1 GTPase Era [Burkholderia paludis]
MPDETTTQALHDIRSVLPDRANDLARLLILRRSGVPTVTVIGKYNHGKSRLLNELIGSDVFSVADRRETVRLSDRIHDGVRWLDAPGLDADVAMSDDHHARQAAWLESDVRLFVHAAKEGEFDAAEMSMLAELRVDDVRTRRRTLIVLTQVDQLSDDTESHAVAHAIRSQMPGVELRHVSSARHRKGLDEGKGLLLERSGVPALREELKKVITDVPTARAHETELLVDEISAQLTELRAVRHTRLHALRDRQARQRHDFDAGLRAVIDKVSQDVLVALAVNRGDDALIPDTAKDVYGTTAGKRERNRLQISYSRACIEIDSFLVGQGVVELPAEQQTASSSINSVMIAVMGVSVKLHKELNRIFGEAAGRERMQRDFTHYYELSADRRALAAQIQDAEAALAATEQALVALSAFNPGVAS